MYWSFTEIKFRRLSHKQAPSGRGVNSQLSFSHPSQPFWHESTTTHTPLLSLYSYTALVLFMIDP